MNKEFVLLTEKEEIYARMLMEVLEDHNIVCVSQPVYGAAFQMKTGLMERLKVLVPADQKKAAEELMEELFNA